jgi:hypothetical protein
MSHVVCFPTWRCELSCEYCSIRNSKIDRTVDEVEWQNWAKVLPQVLSSNSIVDIAGGEPLLYPGILPLLHVLGSAKLHWALTSNLKNSEVVERMCIEKPWGCVCINMSDHIGNPEATVNKVKLREAGYHVNVHRVNHPAAGNHEPDAMLITYQDWSGGEAVDKVKRRCTAGHNHWVAGPNGDMWRCIVAAQTGQPPYGNIFNEINILEEYECDFGCSTCYTEDPGSWGVELCHSRTI